MSALLCPLFFLLSLSVFLFNVQEEVLLRHAVHVLLAHLLKESHRVVGVAMSLPCRCVGDEIPALSVVVFQNQGRGSCK